MTIISGTAACTTGLAQRIFNNLCYDNPWQASQTGVSVGTLCCPTVPNGFGYKCTAVTTGITGGSEPTWPLVLTNTVVDGGVTWTAQDVANPSGKAHPPTGQFGYALTASDLDGFRLLAYNTAKAVVDEVNGDKVDAGTQISGSLTQEAWTAPTLLNSWANFGSGTTPAGFFKDSVGVIHVRGSLHSGTLNAAAWNFPGPYRPAFQYQFICKSSGVFIEVSIDTSGNLIPGVNGTGSNAFVSLDGITFDTR